uniref:Uncharacterized protein n=1 Tax=Cannabis sativa TaxID=3483 RepID=A0A803PT34_CANSA
MVVIEDMKRKHYKVVEFYMVLLERHVALEWKEDPNAIKQTQPDQKIVAYYTIEELRNDSNVVLDTVVNPIENNGCQAEVVHGSGQEQVEIEGDPLEEPSINIQSQARQELVEESLSKPIVQVSEWQENATEEPATHVEDPEPEQPYIEEENTQSEELRREVPN